MTCIARRCLSGANIGAAVRSLGRSKKLHHTRVVFIFDAPRTDGLDFGADCLKRLAEAVPKRFFNVYESDRCAVQHGRFADFIGLKNK